MDPEVIEIPDIDPDNGFQTAGPQNPVEAGERHIMTRLTQYHDNV